VFLGGSQVNLNHIFLNLIRMYKKIFTAVLIVFSIILSQACTSDSDRRSVAEVTKLEKEWKIVNDKVNVLNDSLQAVLGFCKISGRQLKNDAEMLVITQSHLQQSVQLLSSTIYDEQEKILDIAAGYEDFSIEWERLTKEVRKLKKDIAAGKISESKSTDELKFYRETLVDAEKIVEGIKSALEETSVSIRENIATYEAEIQYLKRTK
jgi:predicted  nucleic acid-binding Zn-ribbon protein